MAVAARGCSAPRAGEEGAEPGKERVHSKETLFGVKRGEHITLEEGTKALVPELACSMGIHLS